MFFISCGWIIALYVSIRQNILKIAVCLYSGTSVRLSLTSSSTAQWGGCMYMTLTGADVNLHLQACDQSKAGGLS